MELNFFLVADGVEGTKGGGRFIEDPLLPCNFTFQTRGLPLGAFEDRFAEDLMSVFRQGHTLLSDVVATLVEAGSVDGSGQPWTESSLTLQLRASAALLFSTVIGGAHA